MDISNVDGPTQGEINGVFVPLEQTDQGGSVTPSYVLKYPLYYFSDGKSVPQAYPAGKSVPRATCSEMP